MSMLNGLAVQKCSLCGQEWIQSHYCPKLNAPHQDGAGVPVAPTEVDVRRIVREELAAAATTGAVKPRPELLALAELCGAILTGKPDGSEAITVVFTISAWRAFDGALLISAYSPLT